MRFKEFPYSMDKDKISCPADLPKNIRDIKKIIGNQKNFDPAPLLMIIDSCGIPSEGSFIPKDVFSGMKEVEIIEASFDVIIKKEKGGYSAECFELSGCISQGKTLEEVEKNMKEAIKGYLKLLKKYDQKMPSSVKRKTVELTISV